MEHRGWTAAELDAMTTAERELIFGGFDDAPELAARAHEILESSALPG